MPRIATVGLRDPNKSSPVLCNRLTIRHSSEADAAAIAIVVTNAFGQPQEADLALALIAAPERTISLVAECNGRIVGHVLLTEIGAPTRAVALAPLAVEPEFREMQIGVALVREGLAQAAGEGYQAAFVLGRNAYYERFGFRSPLADSFDVPWQGAQFMALELTPGALAGKSGALVYPDAFFA